MRPVIAALLAAAAALAAGCEPVAVVSADLHADRFARKGGSGMHYERRADGSESFRAWHDQATDASAAGAGAGFKIPLPKIP